ncbi:hypothetical protein AMTRI_Chr08g205560 [Amborella trichopoda]
MHIKMDIFEVSMSGCWIKVCEICEVHGFEIFNWRLVTKCPKYK